MWEEEYQFVVLIALASAGMLVGYLVLQIGERLMRRHLASKNRNFGGGWENTARNAVEEAATGGAVGYAAFVQKDDAIRVRPVAAGLTVTWQASGEARAFFELAREDEAAAVFELLREIYWSERSAQSVPTANLWETTSRRPVERFGEKTGHELCLFELEGGFRLEERFAGSIRGAAILGDRARGKRLCELLQRCPSADEKTAEAPPGRFAWLLGWRLSSPKKEPKASASSPYQRSDQGPGEVEASSPPVGGSFDEARRSARESAPIYEPEKKPMVHCDQGFDKLFR